MKRAFCKSHTATSKAQTGTKRVRQSHRPRKNQSRESKVPFTARVFPRRMVAVSHQWLGRLDLLWSIPSPQCHLGERERKCGPRPIARLRIPTLQPCFPLNLAFAAGLEPLRSMRRAAGWRAEDNSIRRRDLGRNKFFYNGLCIGFVVPAVAF